jgi:hypothetical protein
MSDPISAILLSTVLSTGTNLAMSSLMGGRGGGGGGIFPGSLGGDSSAVLPPQQERARYSVYPQGFEPINWDVLSKGLFGQGRPFADNTTGLNELLQQIRNQAPRSGPFY